MAYGKEDQEYITTKTHLMSKKYNVTTSIVAVTTGIPFFSTVKDGNASNDVLSLRHIAVSPAGPSAKNYEQTKWDGRV